MSSKLIALVTSANKRLSFETSRQLAKMKIKVLMGARKELKGRTAAQKLQSEGLDVESILLDITKKLATLAPKGPTGKFFHFNEELPW